MREIDLINVIDIFNSVVLISFRARGAPMPEVPTLKKPKKSRHRGIISMSYHTTHVNDAINDADRHAIGSLGTAIIHEDMTVYEP